MLVCVTRERESESERERERETERDRDRQRDRERQTGKTRILVCPVTYTESVHVDSMK